MANIVTDKKEAYRALSGTPVNADGRAIEYSGQGDVSLDLGPGGNSFADAEVGSVTLQIINDLEAGQTKKIVICPGWYWKATDIKDENGNPLDGIIAEKIAEKLTVTSSNGSVADFLNYLKYHPSTLKEIKVKVNDENDLDIPLFYRELSPLGASSSDKLIPSTYANEHQDNPKMITIPQVQTKNWVLGVDSLLYTSVKAGHSLSITFTFGASANSFKELKRKNQMGRAFIIRNDKSIEVVG